MDNCRDCDPTLSESWQNIRWRPDFLGSKPMDMTDHSKFSDIIVLVVPQATRLGYTALRNLNDVATLFLAEDLHQP